MICWSRICLRRCGLEAAESLKDCSFSVRVARGAHKGSVGDSVAAGASHALELTSVGNRKNTKTLTRFADSSGGGGCSRWNFVNNLADLVHPLSEALPAICTTCRQ